MTDAEASLPVRASAVDQEPADPVFVGIVRPELDRHLEADTGHPALDPPAEQAGLGRRPIAPVIDGHPVNLRQVGEHPRHVEELRRQVPPGDQAGPVEVADRRARVLPARDLE